MFNSFDSYEFTHTLYGKRIKQGVNRSQVITYTLDENSKGEIVGMILYVAAIVLDLQTGVGRSATYTLDADEALKFRDWFISG